MIRVVVDTNVVVSANLVDAGLPASILDLAANQKILICVSGDILVEYQEVLRRPRFKLALARIESSMALIRTTSKLIKPRRILNVSPHEPDNRFYECAEAAKADFLITGNTKHFPESHKTTRIVSPREFIDLIGPMLVRSNR